jgi:hypothetical protein
MSAPSVHDDWLSLIEISGPFLAVPVLKEAFPQGLEELDATKRKRLRQAYEEWREALELEDAQFAELHVAWIDEVLSRGLELDEDGKGDVLKRADWCAANLQASLPEHGVTLSPDLAVIDEQRANKPLLLIQIYAQDVDLDATLKQDGWAATPADRMVALCRSLGCRLGLVTNGERWMLVDAPVGAVTTFASWYARIWSQEPITLQAFVHLLGIRRFFVDESEQLPSLFERSLKFQDEVTDALGEQVRRAVEVLIQTLDKADQDRNRELLHDVKEPELYEAALTVMMRLVFLLSAEERGLLLMGDERYEANYALSTLRMQLRKESEEILERRWDAWSRLLAMFRAVFGGIEHENLRLPALGGSLFDPDRFPFLEGRAKGSNWRSDAATPLPIDNRTVLLLLEAIQQFQGRTLSYRALDVEQIGYVYEGLLERTVKRTDEVTLELDATKSAKTPWIKLAELDSARLDGAARLAELLQERSGSSASRVRNDLAKPVDDSLADRLLTACLGDTTLRDRVKPYAHLLRTDPWGYPLVYPAGAFIVTTGSDRRETGTHYTPKSLTEAIVAETLTPVAYVGPAEGTPRDQWALKSPAELLDLKICDPAMGSGAFLVQACRWLSDRLVESWSQVETTGKTVSVDGEVLGAGVAKEPLPRDSEARSVIARRLIAERCLYGVDLNPLAVELAKLSIWLVTLAKGRPFGFLDHNLRCGDSLLGIHRLDQLTELSMTPGGKGQQPLFGQNILRAVQEAIELRQRLREVPIRDIRDVEVMAQLDAEARRRLEVSERMADAFIAEVFALNGHGSALDNAITSLAVQAGEAINGDQDALASINRRIKSALSIDLPSEKSSRLPFHWPLEFPEVFQRESQGFEAIIGNPPFLGGRRIRSTSGLAYLTWLTTSLIPSASGNADLCAFFFRRAHALLKSSGCLGLVATNTIAQGDTKKVGLDYIITNSSIFSAIPDFKWPGHANVTVSIVFVYSGPWRGLYNLNQSIVSSISSSLVEAEENDTEPKFLKANEDLSFQGSIVLGKGFVLDQAKADSLVKTNSKNLEVIFRYLRGEDFTSDPEQKPKFSVINFFDWPLNRESAPPGYLGPVAEDYPDCLEIISSLVMPERTRRDSKGEYVLRKPLPQKWWIYSDKRPALYKAIKGKSRILFHSFTGKYVAFSFVPVGYVYAGPHNVFNLDEYSDFAILQSTLHQVWAWKHCSTMKTDLRYANKNLFGTFPFPSSAKQLKGIGEEYYSFRQSLMVRWKEGLTAIYNKFNDPNDESSDIQRLRNLHRAMDEAVLSTYDWTDLDLNHGFHSVGYLPENDRLRFTISEAARLEVLRRLTALNRQRYDEEAAQGLHGGIATRSTVRAQRSGRTSSTDSAQPAFNFDEDASATRPNTDPADAILNFLVSRTAWHAKADVLAATGITDGQWSTAITELIAGGKVERQGERRGARYRAVNDNGEA